MAKFIFKQMLILAILLHSANLLKAQNTEGITKEDVKAAMRKASDFMANTVSCNGGYLWSYKEDLSERFGEIPARKSQIWVQGQGTPAMGDLFLDMYESTGEEVYLQYAKRAGDALIYGQHPLGGWHYFIDFDEAGLSAWYADTASQFIVGWEEFRHFYGNCTYDDNVTQSATKYLMRLYMKTLDPAYYGPMIKALNFILISQYPSGGWPQRFPLRYEFAHDGFPDYTSYYTLNDEAMNSTIDVLVEAYTLLGNEKYLEAAKRGADFFMIAQGPEGHAGWTDQFDMNLKPATGRTHEPASYQVRYTKTTIEELEKMFLLTGDRRYLRPIPAALDWMDSSIIGINDRGNPEFATWYDPETNYPILRETLPEVTNEGYMKYKYTVDKTVKFVKFQGKLPVRELFEQISNVEPGKEKELYLELFGENKKHSSRGNRDISQLINSLNGQGAWVEKITVHDIAHTMDQNFESVFKKGAYNYAVKDIQGISIRTFMRNMRIFMKYLQND